MIADATTSDLEFLRYDKIYENTTYSSPWVDEVSVFDLPRSVIDSFKTLFSYRQLPENWDSYGSLPPTENAIKSAEAILSLTLYVKALSAPYLRPLSGGGIQISWKGTNRELDLAILREGEIDFLQCEDDDVIHETQAVPPDQVLFKLGAYIDWVTASAS